MPMTPHFAPQKRRRRAATSRGDAVDGCAHFTKAASVFAQRLREKATDNETNQHDAERLARYCSAREDQQQQCDASVREDVYACLSCSFTGIREHQSHLKADTNDDDDDTSFMAHAILNDHPLGLLTRKQQLYCACCRDFIYPDALLEIKGGNRTGLSINVRRLKSNAPSSSSSFWRNAMTNSNSNFPPATPRRPSRRGLVNMGNTCYMNVVLQAFAHNALLQHYFLVAKGHGTTICKQTRKLQHQQAVAAAAAQQTSSSSSSPSSSTITSASPHSPSTPICLGCDLSEFMATLSPATALAAPTALPFVPHKVMEAFWGFAPSFIGSQQHDAHEFFLAFLNGLHAHTHQRVFVPGGMSPRFTPTGKSLCDCVVHQHFSGVLVSQVECAVCDQVSSTFDPFLDLSLSLDMPGSDGDKHQDANAQSPSPLSLDSLLHKFTAEEHLRGINRVYCRRCNAYANMSKRLRIHRLPNVLVVHIKRLDFHKQQKLSDFVEFPLTQLSLEEFQADRSSDVEADEGPVTPRGVDNVGYPSDGHDDPNASLYDLAAVVNHHGESVQGGHYTAFIQSAGPELSEDDGDGGDVSPNSNWFLFDDTKVTSATEAQVLESQA